MTAFTIIVEGPVAIGKSTFIHRHLIPALRDANLGADFYDEGSSKVSMHLLGQPVVKVIERQTPIGDTVK